MHFLIASPAGSTTTEPDDPSFYEIQDLAEAGEVNLVWRDGQYGQVLHADLVDADADQIVCREATYR